MNNIQAQYYNQMYIVSDFGSKSICSVFACLAISITFKFLRNLLGIATGHGSYYINPKF